MAGLVLGLPEQLPVDEAGLACGLKAKLFIEGAGQLVVAAGDRLAQPESVFGLERQAPA
jgi:hypothetical protein